MITCLYFLNLNLFLKISFFTSEVLSFTKESQIQPHLHLVCSLFLYLSGILKPKLNELDW